MPMGKYPGDRQAIGNSFRDPIADSQLSVFHVFRFPTFI
jgi:hypothetical protein